MPLEGEEHGDHGDRRDGCARHEHPVVGIELPLEGRQANLHWIFRRIVQDHERKDERVPIALEREDREHRQRGT